MRSRDGDMRIARRLEKRGKWPSLAACLREVHWWTVNASLSKKELDEKIDAGELDPPGKTGGVSRYRVTFILEIYDSADAALVDEAVTNMLDDEIRGHGPEQGSRCGLIFRDAEDIQVEEVD